MPLGSRVVGFQNSIPCKEEFSGASFGLFQYVLRGGHSVCRSNEDKDTVAVVIEGDKLRMAGTGSMVPKDQKCVPEPFCDRIDFSWASFRRRRRKSNGFLLRISFLWSRPSNRSCPRSRRRTMYDTVLASEL